MTDSNKAITNWRTLLFKPQVLKPVYYHVLGNEWDRSFLTNKNKKYENFIQSVNAGTYYRCGHLKLQTFHESAL